MPYLGMPGAPFIPFEVAYPQDDIRKISGTLKDANAVVQATTTLYIYARSSGKIVSTLTSAADGTWSTPINYDPAGFDVVWYHNEVPQAGAYMISPIFTT